MASQDLVTVYTVQSAAEAEIVCNALKSVGIHAVVGGETQGGFAGVLEIDVQTKEEDVDKARKYLRQLRKEKKERRKQHLEEKKARAGAASSEAIQEMRPPVDNIQKPPE